ncbi:hypothetical protein D3C86_2171020 [compost metagenome]
MNTLGSLNQIILDVGGSPKRLYGIRNLRGSFADVIHLRAGNGNGDLTAAHILFKVEGAAFRYRDNRTHLGHECFNIRV